MAGCDQSTGAEPQLSCDENEPTTMTSIEQVSISYAYLINVECCCEIKRPYSFKINTYYKHLKQ